ncbi:hypothetical protein [Spiribacter salinus]|jgi:hypothetical protein|uniref:hypothetical protein n=1 Tax=Spiribacter salinus TaxID=1335746 RepID=UPI001C968197|nr:hypothetical protein [Spiribacter salinus]MBY5268409.1 hypothetical protein [Spiribacter salinus]
MLGAMIGLFKLIRLMFGLIDPASNALSNAPLEWKYLATNILAFMWCVSFGLYIGEYIMIGYSIIGHMALITMCFLTFFLMRHSRRNFDANQEESGR